MRFKQGRELKKTKIEIIPMIDTMFFLLVFFILSSVGILKLQGLPVNLPDAKSSDRQKPAEITISIDANRQMKINNTNIRSGDNVAQILEHEINVQSNGSAASKVNAEVVINADRAVPSGLVVRTLNDAASAGVGKVSIATQNLGAGAAPVPGGQ